jgi:TPR repeat protein
MRSFSELLDVVNERLEPKPSLNREYVKFAEVLSLYRKATRRSDVAAMTRLGELCRAGNFTAQSKAEAYRWFNRAAAQGHPPALKARDELGKRMTGEEIQGANKSETGLP